MEQGRETDRLFVTERKVLTKTENEKLNDNHVKVESKVIEMTSLIRMDQEI